MNRFFLFSLFFLIAIGCFSVSYSANINFASKTFGIKFEDESLTDKEKTIIIKDIRKVLSTTPSSAKLKVKKSSDKEDVNNLGRIDPGPEGHRWPREYWKNGFGQYLITQKEPKRELIISKDLCDAFQKAIFFRKKHQEAFDKLNTFLKTLEKGFDSSVMNFEEKRDLFWFSPGQEPFIKESYYDENIRELNKLDFHEPSIMSFKEAEVNSRSIVQCKPVVSSPEKPNTFFQMVLIYDGIKWHIRAY